MYLYVFCALFKFFNKSDKYKNLVDDNCILLCFFFLKMFVILQTILNVFHNTDIINHITIKKGGNGRTISCGVSLVVGNRK